MTTPERLRRRQRIEGWFLVVIGIGLVVSTIYFRHEDMDQRACQAANFEKQNQVLQARSELGTREANVARLESRATRILFRDGFAAKNQADLFAAYGDYRERIATIDESRKKIAKERRATPVPDFPKGTCDA